MIVDEPAKVFLRNVLSKSKSQVGELRREVDRKRRDVEAVRALKQKVRNGTEKKKDEVEVVTHLFALQQDLHNVNRRRMTAEVEMSTITAVVGDVTQGAKNHNFKSQTFKIPTNCDLCGERIWGLSAKGFDCRDCGYTCHSKCEMKVPADCPGEQTKDERKKLKGERQEVANKLLTPSTAPSTHASESPQLSRSNTMNSLSSQSARRSISTSALEPPAEEEQPRKPSPTPAATGGRRNRVVAPPPAAYITDSPGHTNGNGGESEKKGKMLYTFDASGDGELSVQEGRDVALLEPDGKFFSPGPTIPHFTGHDIFLFFLHITNIRWPQMAQAGSRSGPATRKASSRPATWNLAPSPPCPHHKRAPRPRIPPRRRPLSRRQWARKRAPPWPQNVAPRSSSTSRRCTSTRRSRRQSTP